MSFPREIERLIVEYYISIKEAVDIKLSIDELKYYKNLLNLKKDSYLKHDSFYKACQQNRLEIAQWISSEFKFSKEDAIGYNINNLTKACDDGKITKNQMLDLVWKITPLKTAYINNNINIVEWLANTFSLSTFDILPSDTLLPYICRFCSIEMVSWILNKSEIIRPDALIRRKILFQVATRSEIEFAEWITDRLKYTRDDWATHHFNTLYNACRTGNIKFIKWMVEKFKLMRGECINPTNHFMILKALCTNGHLIGIKYLLSLFKFKQSQKIRLFRILSPAAIQGNNPKLYHWLDNDFARRRQRTKRSIKKLNIVEKKVAEND